MNRSMRCSLWIYAVVLFLSISPSARSEDGNVEAALPRSSEIVDAIALLADGDPDGSAEALGSILDRLPRDAGERDRALGLWALSAARIDQGRYTEAEELAASSRRLWEELGERPWAAEAENYEAAASQLREDPDLDASILRVHLLDRLGRLEIESLRLGDALRHFDDALALIEGRDLPTYEAGLRAYRGTVLSLLGQHESAATDIGRFEELAGDQAPELAPVVEMLSALVQGMTAGNFDDALASLKRLDRLYGDRLPPEHAETMRFLSMLETERYEEATARCRDLFEPLESDDAAPPTGLSSSREMLCSAMDLLANTTDDGAPQEQLVALAEALEQTVDSQPAEMQEAMDLLVEQFAQMARNSEDPARWPSGEKLEQTVDSLERRLGSTAPPGLRSGLDAALSPLIRVLVTAEVQAGDIRGAFELAEQARSRELLDRLVDARAAGQPDPEVASRIASLRTRRHDLERQITEARWSDEGGDDELRDELRRVRRKLDEIFHRLALQRPEAKRVRPLGLSTIRDALDERTTMVSFLTFSSGTDDTLAWVLDRNDLHLVRLPIEADALDRRIRLLLDRLQALDDPWRTAEALYRDLWSPIREHIRTDRVLVIPHGPLQDLPFAALRDPDSGQWLTRQVTLSYAPSGSAHAHLARRPGGGKGTALILGNPTGDLPATEREARGVAALWGTRALVGDAATEAALRERSPGARLIHIAAHGVSDRQDPLFTRIRLAPDAAGATEPRTDGRLELHEVWNELDLRNADLVVVPACHTNDGPRTDGDEVTNLSRAFLLAGARSTVTASWAIPDDATASLMLDFHRRLAEGAGAAEALRQAQLVAIDSPDRSHPWFWAAFTLHGASRP